MLKPFVSEQNYWMLQHHGIFQGYYFFHYLGLDRNQRDAFRNHPWYAYTEDFCATYDQNSFDPHYDTLPLEAFEPLVRRVLAAPRASLYTTEKS
jgi:predicted HD phosphohydrolase